MENEENNVFQLGFLTLNSLHLDVESYFACEIDEDAIRIARHHFGSKIDFIGRIEDLTEEKLKSYLPIHLLIGGSPCNDLSKANPNRKGLYGESVQFTKVFSRKTGSANKKFLFKGI